MDKNCNNCTFRERSYSEYPCEKCRNANFWTPSDNLLEFAIEELEKTKEKLKDSVYLHRDFVFGVIDNRIKELKGDNK